MLCYKFQAILHFCQILLTITMKTDEMPNTVASSLFVKDGSS